LDLARISQWLSDAGIYWLNFWRLAFAYVLGKIWFLMALAGFLLVLRGGMQHEAQGRVQLGDPSRVARGVGRPYRPYGPGDLRRRLRRQ
jgi:hypothetical protein